MKHKGTIFCFHKQYVLKDICNILYSFYKPPKKKKKKEMQITDKYPIS